MTIRCPTCGADNPDGCRYRYEDIGCEHPAVVAEVAEALGFVDGEQMETDEG